MSYYDSPDRQWGNAQWAPQQPAGEPSALRGLRTALMVLLAVSALISVLAVVAYAGRIDYVNDVLESGSIDSSRAENADGFVAVTQVLWVVAFLAIAPVFIVWQHRHAKNGRILGARQDGVATPGWAVGGWFIPFANLVIPAVNLHANGRASDLEGQRAGTGGRGPAIVVVWAVCLALAGFLSTAASGTQPQALDADFLDQLQSSDGLALGSELASVVAAVLAMVMVHALTSRQEAALAARAATIGAQPAYGSWPAPPGTPYGQVPYGQPQFGQQPHGQQYGQPRYGQAPYPQQPYGQQYGQPPSASGYTQPYGSPPAYGPPPSGSPYEQPAQQGRQPQNPPPSPFAPAAGESSFSRPGPEAAPSDADEPPAPPAPPPPVPPSAVEGEGQADSAALRSTGSTSAPMRRMVSAGSALATWTAT